MCARMCMLVHGVYVPLHVRDELSTGSGDTLRSVSACLRAVLAQRDYNGTASCAVIKLTVDLSTYEIPLIDCSPK